MTITNSENVEFCAYFVGENKQQSLEIDSNIHANDLKVYIEIAVKNEGYFNGKISLENASFKFKNDQKIENEFVKEIQENTIILNQINAGNTAKIELGIEFANNENIELTNLSKDNQISLIGTYINSKKNTEIQGNTSVKINWISPEKLNAKIGAKILTNNVYEIEKEKKRIVQILVDSKLENDVYPVKNTNLKLNVPKGAESVKVHSRSTEATSEKTEFNEENYKYNSEMGILEINIQNEVREGKISWLKDKKDSLVITYIYPEDVDIEKQEIEVYSVITTYDEKQVNANCKISIENEINGILTSSINLDETHIYKGKLYTGEDRYYTTSTIVNVNYALMDKIKIEEKEAVICIEDKENKANIQYTQSKISKSEFEKIFGQHGYINIMDQEGNTVANVNKDSKEDEAGYINIDYNSGVKSIIINTSKPQVEGTLEIHHRKVILDNKYSREEIAQFTDIKEEIDNGYNSNSVKTIELKNTESKANIKINKEKLSSITTNQNVEIVATLETDDESKDLYKNPTVDIIFPIEFKEINISSAKALYRNGLKVSDCKKLKNEKGNIVLHIDFDGEQEKYNNEIVNGLEIHIYATITIEKTTPEKNSELIMNYTNDNGNKDLYSVSKTINIQSQNGLVLYNSLSDYNKENNDIEIIAQEQTTAKLDMNSKAQTAKVETALINNYDEEITDDIVIIGEIPTENDKNTFDTKISNLKVSNDAKVLYSANINAKANDDSWTKDSTNAKKYKVVLDNIESGEVVKVSYDMTIPAKLSYNEKGVLATSINYSYDKIDMTDSSNIIFETESAILKTTVEGFTTITNSGLEVNVVSISGNKELKDGDSIYEGETIKYTVKIKNNSGKNLEDLNIKATQTNGLIYDLVEKEVYNPSIYETEDATGIEHYWELSNSNEKEFGNISLQDKETITLEYQTIAKKQSDTDVKTYGDISIVSIDNSIEENITTYKNDIQDAKLNLLFTPAVSEECIWYSETVQQSNLKIVNTTDNKLDDIKIEFTLSERLKCNYDNYVSSNSDIQIEIVDKKENELGQTIITLKVLSLEAGQTGEIYIKPEIIDLKNKKEEVELFATATIEGDVTYTSNNVIRSVTRTRKNIKIEQIAKVNGKTVDENTIANNEDEIEFAIKIKNEEDEKIELYLTDYLQNGLELKSIDLINTDLTKQDITEKCVNQYFGYSISLEKEKEITIIIKAKLNTLNLAQNTITNKFEISCNSIIYFATVSFKANIEEKDDDKFNITITQTSNPNDKTIIKDGQEIEYKVNIKNVCNYDRVISIIDTFNTVLKDIKVFIDDKDVTSKYLTESNLEISDYTIKGDSELNITIKAKINLQGYDGNTISNTVLLKSNYPDYASNTITYYTSQKTEEDKDDNQDKEEKNENYNIKGKAWLDINKNGKRDETEQAISNLEVRVIDTNNKQVLDIKAITGEDGTYQLDLPEGKYIIVFMYNNEQYYITTYHADGIEGSLNSDAISKEFTMDNLKGTYGATDVINLTSNKNNIDIGLINRNKFDFKLDKYITKVVVTNKGGTKTYNLDKTTLGKVEIASKYLSDSTVLVEYTIKITNVGDIQGTVEKIVDNMPADMTFSSSLNKDWYMSGKYLYNESISDKTLDKDESVEIKLILNKKMTESNTGLVNNTASIKAYKNSNNEDDKNLENNKGSADLIIAVKTGAAIRLVLLVLSLTICIMTMAYFIIRRFVY